MESKKHMCDNCKKSFIITSPVEDKEFTEFTERLCLVSNLEIDKPLLRCSHYTPSNLDLINAHDHNS